MGAALAASTRFDPGWATAALILVGLLGGAIVALRGGGGTAVAGLQATNRELERQVHTLTEKVHVLEKENAELRGRTDVAAQVAPLMQSMKDHEVNAASRSESMLAVLHLIARQLGPEHGLGA